MRGSARSLTASLVFAALLASARVASAYPVHARWLRGIYGGPSRCESCHAHGGGTERSPFGRDWANAGASLAAFRAVDTVDSDGDGTSNKDELAADSNPGDARSVPGNPGTAWRRPGAPTPIPTEQLELVFDRMDRIEAWEPDFTREQIAEIEAGAGTRLTDLDRYPTLYFGVRGGERTSIAVFSQFEQGGHPYHLLTSIDRSGSIDRIALFQAGEGESADHRPLLDCLSRRRRHDIAAAATSCGGGNTRPRVAAGILRAEQIALWTVHVLGTPAPSAPAEPGPATGTVAARADDEPSSPAGEPSPAAPALDFRLVVPTSSTSSASGAGPIAAVLAGIAMFIAAIAFTVRLAARRRSPADANRFRLRRLPPSLKLLCGMALAIALLVQSVAMVDGIWQTSEVHGSAGEYFQSLSWARLLGTSHSHLFGYCVLFGMIALLVCGTPVREGIKCAVVATLMWSGVFDVASWWAIKAYSPCFEWMMITTGAAVGLTTLLSCLFIVRELSQRAEEKA